MKTSPNSQTLAALDAWLRDRLNLSSGEIRFSQASNGFSAETWFASITPTDGSLREIVLRLEQPGGEIFLETDIAMQARTLSALAANGVPVPPLLWLEEDRGLIDRRFLAMERVAGRNFPQAPSYYANGWVLELSAERRAVLWNNALSLLGQINRLGADDGFAFLDRPHHGRPSLEQYLGWLRAWREDAVGPAHHPVIDAALDWLDSNRPADLPVNVIWGDSNPCNILFDDDLAVAAALDFEAAALGPAEVDLGWWLFMDARRGRGKPALSGVPDRAGSIAIYERALGRPVVAIDYFETLGGVRMALVIARTARRLIDLGMLPADTPVAIENPMSAELAGLIGVAPPPVGDAFHAFVRAVGAR